MSAAVRRWLCACAAGFLCFVAAARPLPASDEHDHAAEQEQGHADEHEEEPAHDDEHEAKRGHADEHKEQGHGDEHEHGDEHARTFSVGDFARRGVTLATAAPGVVDAGIELPAEVRVNADRVAHLAPRFPGIVREVRKKVGDSVRAGEVMARIESENLVDYSLAAAIDGTVLARHITPGEVAVPSSSAFIVADLSTVWVDIHVHQKALAEIGVGQPVHIASRDATLAAEGEISYITPVLDPTTRTATARVVLPNPGLVWRPGLFVIATVERGVASAVVVPRRALHRHDGTTVVFVAAGEEFAPRPVTVGTSGRSTVEISAGLASGERVADESSFLVKAELEKSSAAHEH